MAGKVRYLTPRDGRWYARLVVPKELRPYVGKMDLRNPLGVDYREALKKLPGAVALLQHEIALGERRAAEAGLQTVAVARYPLAPDQIALRNYQARLDLDEQIRNTYPAYATGEIDDQHVEFLRAGIAGKLRDHEYVELVGDRIEHYRRLGSHDEAIGSEKWRIIARALCVSESALERLHAIERTALGIDGNEHLSRDLPVLVLRDITEAEILEIQADPSKADDGELLDLPLQ